MISWSLVLEDRVQFIFECSQLAAQGKWVVATKMLVEMEADAEDTTANSEVKKRTNAAEEALRNDAEVDRGIIVHRQPAARGSGCNDGSSGAHRAVAADGAAVGAASCRRATNNSTNGWGTTSDATHGRGGYD